MVTAIVQFYSKSTVFSYAEATEEDLKKSDTCTVCWEGMRSARKLPCGHIFHELCLRRWLEQDSSCAICRQTLSLNLNHVLREDGANPEEIDHTMNYLMDALHPQNNGLIRLWSRFMFSSYSDEQVFLIWCSSVYVEFLD
jgi:hypothetical protein